MIFADFSAANWRKSSYSTDAGNCVEVAVAPVWRTSSYSGNASNCVEVASGEHAVGVRDSKNTSGPVLTFEQERWRNFLR